MSDGAGGLQEGWAARFCRRMEAEIGAALAASDPAVRREALEAALGLGREARLRIESEPLRDAAEGEALRNLEEALDLTQAALHRYDICFDPILLEARAHAARAAECLDRVGR